MHKREFIAGTGALAAACGAGLASAAPAATTDAVAASRGSTRRLPALEDRQSRSTWTRYIGQSFTVAGVGALQLARVENGPVAGPQPGLALDQFKLVFDAPAGSRWCGGTCTLRHASGQTLALHLEPSQSGQLHAHFSLLA